MKNLRSVAYEPRGFPLDLSLHCIIRNSSELMNDTYENVERLHSRECTDCLHRELRELYKAFPLGQKISHLSLHLIG